MHMLQEHWLFAEWDSHELGALNALTRRETLPDATQLFAEGDPTPGLHLVLRGAIKIYTLDGCGRERIISLIGPGQFCGEMGVVDSAPSSAWGETHGETELLIIPADAFKHAMLTSPGICLKVCRVLSARLRRADALLSDMTWRNARQRVLRGLLRLAEAAPDGSGRFPVRMTHQELAGLLGTARETVSRVLADLQERGLLVSRERSWHVPSLAALQREIVD